MAHLLVTGGKGQVGTHIAALAAPYGFDVSAPGSAELDITNPEMLQDYLLKAQPDLVINCAAYTAVDKAQSEPQLAHAINAAGPAHLAKAVNSATPIIHLSTDFVFDGTANTPYREEAPAQPVNIYGQSKLAGEKLLLTAHPQSIVLRTAWVYSASHTNFLKTMLQLTKKHDTISVVEDQRGCPTHAEDIAIATLTMGKRILEEGLPAAQCGVYHYCSKPPTSWHGFAKVIFDEYAAQTGKTITLKAIPTSDYPTPAKRPAWSVLDCEKIAQTFGIEPQNWEPRARETVRRVIDQEKRTP